MEATTRLQQINERNIRELFSHCADVQFSYLHFERGKIRKILLAYCEGLYDPDKLQKEIVVNLEHLAMNIQSNLYLKDVKNLLRLPSLQQHHNLEKIPEKIFNGEIIIFFIDLKALFTVDISRHPQRTPTDPNTEISIKGPRDGFIEELSVNVALIRKRFRSNTLYYEVFEKGKRTKTKLGLLYIKDVTNPEFITEIKNRIEKINVDGIISSNQLQELLVDNRYTLFPVFSYTGRPDFAVDSLLRGRFVILIDGSPTAIIGPANLLLLLKSAEDQDYIWLFTSVEWLLRILGLLMAAFFPGFWIALVTFHPDQIPLTLLTILVESRQGVPFPSAIEAFIMLTLFELFREAGLKLPIAIGQTLSVVGGLIIGDAAIRAGLTSPAMLVVIASSFVATFTLVNQSLAGVISVVRIFTLLLSALFGLWGLLVAVFFVFLYCASLRPFGVPYLAPISWKTATDMLNVYFRMPWKKTVNRPKMLDPQDPTRQGGTK
jgi:hypothetical protein